VYQNLGKRLPLRGDLCSMLGSMKVHSNPGLDSINNDQAEDKSDRRDDLEVDEGFDPHPSDLLQVAVTGNADDKRCKDQGRDDRFDQPQKNRTERSKIHSDIGNDPSKRQAQRHANEDQLRECRFGYFHLTYLNQVRKNVMIMAVVKSIKNAPTIGTTRNARGERESHPSRRAGCSK
jgi:hypothetical protein